MTAGPILIWGAGAIGGTLGAYWARAGLPVLMVDIEAAHVEACRTTGLAISGPVEQFRQVVPAVTPDELEGQFEVIVLAVKAQATEAALARLAPHLAPGGYVLSAQNGLNEIAIARAVGAERTMGCFVNFGADWLGPGEILFGNRAAVVVGEIDGSVRERTRQMHAWLAMFEPGAVLTDNIWGYLWGKLAYGAMLFATALTTDSMTANFEDARRFVVFDRLAREVMAVATLRAASNPSASTASIRPVSRPVPRSMARGLLWLRWPSSTATRPRPIPASTATLPCASAAPRSTRRSA
jgi:2-dehydropantoate 2-reductase